MAASRKPRAVKITEAQIQVQVIDYLNSCLRDNAIAFAIPNGGLRSATEAKRLKAQGVTAGVPDLEIIHRGRALFIEMKSAKGTLSASQKFMIPLIKLAGSPVAICRSTEDVIDFLIENDVPISTESITTERIRRGFVNAQAEAG